MIIGMPRLAAPAFLIAFFSVAASCSQIAQKEDDRMEVARRLTDAYYSCVRSSFASQRPTMVDRNMAIDQAFAVCQTEESKRPHSKILSIWMSAPRASRATATR